MEQRIREIIEDSEMILVGIGEELSPSFSGEEGPLEPFFRSRFYGEIGEAHEILRAYAGLGRLLEKKPYFAVTMNTDGLILRSALEEDKIVAPCGSMEKMQCTDHIVEAEKIRDEVLETGDVSRAVCPICGRALQFHTVAAEGYLEEGYLPQWEKYTRWLRNTLNRRLCILELGVGFHYPQVIRFPFEKTAYYNKKATLIRVNGRFPQLPAELRGRGISVPVSPLEFLKDI